MHVDLHEHGCKDKEETEQAVTDDICIEIDRNYTVVYYPLHFQFSATSCMQYHVLNAFSELCKQYSIAVAVRSFSALKRVKTRLRMMQELKARDLRIISKKVRRAHVDDSIKKKLLMCFSNKAIVQQCSSKLSRALL